MSDEITRTLSRGFDWSADGLDWPVTTEVGPGLAGVIADTTRVMWLDPSSGRLAYRGVDIEQLSVDPDFEATAFLLITGSRAVADHDGLKVFRANLRASRSLPRDVIRLLDGLVGGSHPTRVLRAGVSALGCHELSVDDDLDGDRHWRQMRIVGQVASLVGHLLKRRRGRPGGRPDRESSLAHGVLASMCESSPSDEAVEAINLLWVLYAAHGLDAPTFTSMIVASCLADPYYNVVAGLSALRGSRQGGVGERLLEVLLEFADPEDVTPWVARQIAAGKPIPGFGHRAYRMPDPRVVPLRNAASALARRQRNTALYETARALEEAAAPALAAKGVHVNINLYGAVLLRLLGAQPAEVPCLIGAARVAGMVALVRETLDDIRLYRPVSAYVGPPPRNVTRGGSR